MPEATMTSPTSRPDSAVAGDAAASDPQPSGPTTGAPLTSAPTVEDVDRLRTELTELRDRLDSRQRRASAVLALRGVVAAVLIAVTAFALVSSVVGVWAANTALDTDRWVATVAPLPRDTRVA